LLTFLTDVVRFNQYQWMWFVPSAGSLLLAVSVGWILTRFIKTSEPSKWFWIVNLLIAALVGAIKNTSVNLFAGWVGLATDGLWAFRAIGGVFMGLAAVSYFAIATGARFEHRKAVQELNSVQAKLLQQRSNLAEFVSKENQKLVDATQDVLIPRIRKIESLLTSATGVASILDALRSTIEKDLRPLTRGITEARISETPLLEHHAPLMPRTVRLPKQALVPQLVRPWRGVIFNSLAYAWGFVLFDGITAIGLVLVASFIESLIQFAIAKTISRSPSKLGIALLKLATIGLVSASPVVALVFLRERQWFEYVLLSGLCLLVSLGSLLSNAYAFVLDQERAKTESDIQRDNEQLSREIALYEQKIWVFRKSWQLLLHGTVQAALTAAATRLTMANQDEHVRIQLVVQDLQRAEEALQGNPVRNLDLHRSIAELSTAWRGVCEVAVEVTERASRALKRNSEAMFCVNELMREAVSNAVRHGYARKVQISLDREEDSVIEFSASNDGISPPLNRIPGLGSKTFDELTQDWSIRADQRTGKTVLRARVPISI
jgi:two-component sensor histidine kinase